MRLGIAWRGFVLAAVVVACGKLTGAGLPSTDGGDADGGEVPPAAVDSGCPGHTFCEDFDRVTESGAPDLSRWPLRLREDTLALSDAGATTPPFALWMSATNAPLVRSALAVGLPTAKTRLHCHFDARFAAVPSPAVPVRVFQVKFQSAGVSSYFNFYGSPSGFQLGVHEESDSGQLNTSDQRDAAANQDKELVRVDVVVFFDPGNTHATATIGSTTLVVDRPRDGDPTGVEVDVGLTNNNLPDAGTVDVRLDSLVCDAE